MTLALQLHHLDRVARYARDPWSRDFARSVLAQSRRPRWQPSPKQQGVIRRLIADLHQREDEMLLIEDERGKLSCGKECGHD